MRCKPRNAYAAVCNRNERKRKRRVGPDPAVISKWIQAIKDQDETEQHLQDARDRQLAGLPNPGHQHPQAGF
jgi:hypothetical protein